MSFRDDRDALAARVDALDRELGETRQALAEEQQAHKASRARERALAARVEDLEKKLPHEPAAAAKHRTPTPRIAAIGATALVLGVTAAITMGTSTPTPPIVTPPGAMPDTGPVETREDDKQAILRLDALLCVRLMQADVVRRYRRVREAAEAGGRVSYPRLAGGWGTCFFDMKTMAGEPGGEVLAEVVKTSEALHPLLVRADDYYASGDWAGKPELGVQIREQIEPRVAASQLASDRAVEALLPAWRQAVMELRAALPADADGQLVVTAVDVMALGVTLGLELGRPDARAEGSAVLASLLRRVQELRDLADQDMARTPPWPAANTLRLGADLRKATLDRLDETRIWELSWALSRQLVETTYNYER